MSNADKVGQNKDPDNCRDDGTSHADDPKHAPGDANPYLREITIHIVARLGIVGCPGIVHPATCFL